MSPTDRQSVAFSPSKMDIKEDQVSQFDVKSQTSRVKSPAKRYLTSPKKLDI